MSPNEIVYGQKIKLPHDKQLQQLETKEEVPEKMKDWLKTMIKTNRQTAKENINKYYDQISKKQREKIKANEEKLVKYNLGDKVVIREGSTKKMGSEAYNANNFSGVYEIVHIYPNERTYDLKKVNNPEEIRKQINFRKLLKYKENVMEIIEKGSIDIVMKKLSDSAIMPSKTSGKSNTYDVYIPNDLKIAPKSSRKISLEIAINLPRNIKAIFNPKIRYIEKNYCNVFSEILDQNGKESMEIIIQNHDERIMVINRGTKIGEIRIEQSNPIQIHQVSEVANIEK